MHLAKKADDPDVRFDPETGVLGRYSYDDRGARVLRPMVPGELQRFKERVLEAKACYPLGVQSPEELDLGRTYKHAAPLAADPVAVKALLKQISDGEFTNDEIARRKGVSSGYDAIFNYANIPHKPLTQMTVREVDELQDRMRKEIGHTPVGKYQIRQETLRGLVGALKIDSDQKFDHDLQEFLARQLLEVRKLSKFVKGEINSDQFQSELQNEWASIASPSTNRVARGQTLGTSNSQIQPLLDRLKGQRGLP